MPHFPPDPLLATSVSFWNNQSSETLSVWHRWCQHQVLFLLLGSSNIRVLPFLFWFLPHLPYYSYSSTGLSPPWDSKFPQGTDCALSISVYLVWLHIFTQNFFLFSVVKKNLNFMWLPSPCSLDVIRIGKLPWQTCSSKRETKNRKDWHPTHYNPVLIDHCPQTPTDEWTEWALEDRGLLCRPKLDLPQAVRLCKQQNQWKSSREKPTRRLSQFLLLGLHDSATPSLTLFPPPVSLPVVLGVILSSRISDMSLSVHIWHYRFFFLSWEKYFFPDYESNKVYYGNIAK